MGTVTLGSMGTLLQIRQVAHLRSGDMQPARFKPHALEAWSARAAPSRDLTLGVEGQPSGKTELRGTRDDGAPTRDSI